MSTSRVPRTVCFVEGELFGATAVGGAERQIKLLRDALSDAGMDVCIVARRVAGVDSAACVPRARVVEYEGQSGFRIEWIAAVAAAAEECGADVYYQRGMGVFTVAASQAARSVGAAFIWAASSDADMDTLAQRFLRAYRNRRAGARPQSVSRATAASLVDAYIHMQALRARSTADLVITQTCEQRERFLAQGKATHRIETIASLPPEPGVRSESSDRDVVLWVGGNKPLKRPELFLSLAADKGDVARYAMVGKGLDHSWSQSVPVEVIDAVPLAELRAWYSRSLVLVSTSTVEGFPNTFLEAWASGTPVAALGLDPGGVIRRHGLGWVADDLEGLASAIEQARKGGSLIDEMRARCVAYVREYHPRDAIIEQFTALVSRVEPNGKGRIR